MQTLWAQLRITAQGHARRRGISLVELNLALVVMAVLSVAVTTLIAGAGRSQRYVNDTSDALWQAENACRRMSYNLMYASAMSAPTGTTPTNTLAITTQPDAGNGGASYQVTYALSGSNLIETDTRYGTQTLLSGVTSFVVQRQSVASPVNVQVTLTAGSVTRTFSVLCRNL